MEDERLLSIACGTRANVVPGVARAVVSGDWREAAADAFAVEDEDCAIETALEGGSTVITVSDNNTILMDANVDERNVSYVKEGMMVDVNQWGTMCMGTVTSVSLTSNVNNGVATFPAVISIDNFEGLIMPGSYATYSLIASQSNDCMVLPIQAVKSVETEAGSQHVVFVHTEERPENAIDLDYPVDGIPEEGYYPIPVTIGISDSQSVEVLEGVEVGMEVFQQVMYNSMW